MNEEKSNFKSGFVTLLGKPNMGKSTLMNELIGQKLSIITSKAQTTRHRILGILNSKDFQIVYSDTPGIIDAKYELQKIMVKESYESIVGSDVILYIIDIHEKEIDQKIINKAKKENIPIILVINKIDLLVDQNEKEELKKYWEGKKIFNTIISISALEKQNLDQIMEAVLSFLPYHPPYYPEELITDKPERFFVSEIIREKIFINYKKEIPYCTEVKVETYEEKENVVVIRAQIFVERDSQKFILISKKGIILKKVGIQARKDLEKLLDKKVFLELYVKVSPDWRKKKNVLNKFGYH